MEPCKHCNLRFAGPHCCKAKRRTVERDSDFISDAFASLFGGGSDTGSESDSGSCDSD